MKKYNRYVWLNMRLLPAALFLSLATTSFVASAQQRKEKPKAATPPAATAPATPEQTKPQDKTAKGTWRLQVSKQTPQTISLKAVEAPLTEIAADLGKQLNIPVTLSAVMQKQKVTLDFSVLPLDAALRTLAPAPLVDYEVTGDFSAQPKALAVYLNALNEPPPPTSATVRSGGDTVLIEGDTEEGTESYEKAKEAGEIPLVVTYAKNQLTVHAKKQPLVVVLYKVASEIGVSFDMRYESTELVDVNFTNYSLEQAIRSISPSVHFYYRADLQNFEIQPLRITLEPPART